MSEIKIFNFTPISNERQQIHTISFSERIQKGKEGVLKPHRTNFYILLFVTHGISKHLVDFQILEIKKGDILIIRPGQVHAFFKSKDSDGIIIAFTEDFLLHKFHHNFLLENISFLNELSFDSPFHVEDCKRNQVDLLIDMIQQEVSETYDELQESILQNHLSSLLLYFLRIKRSDLNFSSQRTKELLYALKFKSLVEKSYAKNFTVTHYSEQLGITTRNLQKISELHFGRSPKALIQQCILLESKRMLIDPTLQVKNIAYALGFDEPTNFTKFFKKLTNMSPDQFRKSLS